MSRRRTYVMVKVVPKKGEPFERTLKRFMKKVKKERVIEQIKEGRAYEKPSVTKRKAKLQGIKNQKKRIREFEKKVNSKNDNTYSKKRG